MVAYLLYHEAIVTEDGLPSALEAKAIGLFSRLETAIETRERYKGITGFCDYVEGFKILIVDIEGAAERGAYSESLDRCYSVDYEDLDNDVEFWIRFFATEAEAEMARERLITREPFCNNPEGINVYEHILDRCGWVEGFDTYTYYT